MSISGDCEFSGWGYGWGGGGLGAEEGGGAGAGFTTLGGGVGGFSSFYEDSGAYS